MVGFQHVATITQGYVGNISDLTLGQVGGQVVLVGATYAGGGVSIWGWTAAGCCRGCWAIMNTTAS